MMEVVLQLVDVLQFFDAVGWAAGKASVPGGRGDSLNCIGARIGCQCSSMVVSVTCSLDRRPYTSLVAVLMMCYGGATVEYGRLASSALPQLISVSTSAATTLALTS